MAEIFLAKTYGHAGFENLLVIKRILPHIGENAEFVEMSIDEAKVSVALQHPNVVRIYDFGKMAQHYFIAMECVDGKDTRNILRKLARRKQILAPRFAAYIAHEVAKGLHYAHTKTDLQGRPYGIVHRDVSPSNVLVSYDGEVKIVDFGIAKAEINAYETRDGVLKGKFEYMSPEQATGKDVDGRSDIFSLGIITWEMLTGRRLFKSESEIATLKMIRDGDFPKPTVHNPKIPERLEQIVLKALARQPTDRYASGLELADDLREYLFPATPDTLRPDITAFMRDLFADEIADERSRIETGASIARQMKDADPDAAVDVLTAAPPPARAPSSRWIPLALTTAFVLAALGALSVAAVLLFFGPRPVEEVAPPTTGAIDVQVLPEALISLDGVPKGTADVLMLDALEPGVHTVQLVADGYQTIEERVEVVAGRPTRFARTLVQLPAVAQPPVPVVDAPEPSQSRPPGPRPTGPAPPEVAFSSSPTGATVLVDGNEIGRTPVVWKGGKAGREVRVEYRLAGFQLVSATIPELESGRTTFNRTLAPVAVAGDGALTVTLVGGGWANVYIDGKKIDKTAPLKNFALKAGTYEVRVENGDLGIDVTQRVVVAAGQTATVRAGPS
jgi:hypothetical protein